MCIPTASIVNYHSMSMWSRYIGICNCSLPQWINLTCETYAPPLPLLPRYILCVWSPVLFVLPLWLWLGSSPTVSGHSLPHENRNIRLHIVMGSVITGIAYSNSMDMGTCCIGRIGICAITITTAGNTSVRFVRTTKGKCMWMISCRVCASSMCMCRQFSDRLLCCSMPTINRYIRLQVIVWIIRASVTNN